MNMTALILIVSLLGLAELITQEAHAADDSTLPLGSGAEEIAKAIIVDGIERLDAANPLERSHVQVFTTNGMERSLLAEFHRYYYPDRETFEALSDSVCEAGACLPDEQGVFRMDRLDWYGLNPDDAFQTEQRFVHPSEIVETDQQ